MDSLASLSVLLQDSLFYQLAGILIVSGLAGALALNLKQPLIVAFMGVGLLIGPDVLNLLSHESKAIDTLAALGISLLLFLVGLKMDIGLIRTLGPVALATGFAQVILTAIMGFGMAHLMGFDMMSASFIGIALAFSSTIVVIKMLTDRHASESLYGKIAIGILIVQDILVILAMVVITAMGKDDTKLLSAVDFLYVFGEMAALILFTLFFIRYLANPLTHRLARSPELIVIFALGLAATMAAVCYALDLSKELGGLLAGVALASSPLRDVIAARLAPLRDFLLLFFFVGLGAQLRLDGLATQIEAALILSAFVLIIKPLIIMAIMGYMGYRKRTGFLTGTTLSQISEFSLIFIAMALAAGQVNEQVAGIITLTGMITITLSVYAMIYQEKTYGLLEKPMQIFERKQPKYEEDLPNSKTRASYDILIFGLGRYGLAMAHEFKEKGAKVLGIDFDPQSIKRAQELGIPAIYGDASDPEFARFLPLKDVRTVIFAFPHISHGVVYNDVRLLFAKILRDMDYSGHIAAIQHDSHDHELFLKNGIDIFLQPHRDAACQGAEQIMDMLYIESPQSGSSRD